MKEYFKVFLVICVVTLVVLIAACEQMSPPTVDDVIKVESEFKPNEFLNLNEMDVFGYKNSNLLKSLCKIPPKRQPVEKFAERNNAYWVKAEIKDCPQFFYINPAGFVQKSKAPKLIKKGWKNVYENYVHKKMTMRMLKHKNPWKWARFVKAMAKAESNWNPNTFYVEKTIFDRHGKNVVSRGLLQISMESANGYGCNIKEARELHDPETNIKCGLKIMDKLIRRDGQVMGKKDGKWVGLSRYWSVLREGGSGYKRFMKQYKR